MRLHITPASEIRRTDHQISEQVGDECVILDLRAGVYYGLDEVGSRVWAMLQKPHTVEAIRDLLVAELDVNPTRCEKSLMRLLHELAAAGLIQVTQGHA